jgi:hypothetical protein
LILLVIILGAMVLGNPVVAETNKPHETKLTLSPEIPWTGDLDGMIKRRMIRAPAPNNKTLYFIDKGAEQHGISYDLMVKFEGQINHEYRHRHERIYLVSFPPLEIN